jgi:hypothetical protein
MEWLENPDYAELGARPNRGIPTGYRPVVSKVTLRAEIEGSDQRHLWAQIDSNGDLVIAGQDLGPSVEQFFGEREYEWAHTIKKQHIPQFLELLNQDPGANVMTVLQGYAGERCDLVCDAITAAADKFPIEFWSRF